jgi:bifunctional DNase/RNase
MKLVDVLGLHIEASSGSPLVLLREHDAPHRVLPIFVGGPEAASIALALSGEHAPRPLAHDVMASLVQSLDAHVDAVEVTDVRDGAFLAAIAVTGPAGGHRLDTRPSDGIALAVRLGAPLYVSDEVLDEAGSVLEEIGDDADLGPDGALDDDAIDAVVADFHDFLAELEPGDFALTLDDADEYDEPAGPDDDPEQPLS